MDSPTTALIVIAFCFIYIVQIVCAIHNLIEDKYKTAGEFWLDLIPIFSWVRHIVIHYRKLGKNNGIR